MLGQLVTANPAAAAPTPTIDPDPAGDSAPEIQAAIDDAAAAGGGVVTLAAGTFAEHRQKPMAEEVRA